VNLQRYLHISMQDINIEVYTIRISKSNNDQIERH